MNGLAAFPAVFGAGLLASLSPCVYPLIPITLGFFGTQASDRRTGNIVSYAAGQIVAFAALGFLAVTAGETFGFSSELRSVNLGVGLVLVTAGAIALLGRWPVAFTRLAARLRGPRRATFTAPAGWLGAAALGAGSALVASPCTSPILAGVLATMAVRTGAGRGIALMLCYALGFTSLFLALGLGVLARLPRSGNWLSWLRRTSAAVLLAAGAFYFYKGLT